jgi:uncharacterized membrane protein
MWDGFFHIATYAFTQTSTILLWLRSSPPHEPWSWKLLVVAILMGFAIFNLVEGILDHQILGIHMLMKWCLSINGSIGALDFLSGEL